MSPEGRYVSRVGWLDPPADLGPGENRTTFCRLRKDDPPRTRPFRAPDVTKLLLVVWTLNLPDNWPISERVHLFPWCLNNVNIVDVISWQIRFSDYS